MRHSLPQLANPGAIQRRNPVMKGRWAGRGRVASVVGSIKDVLAISMSDSECCLPLLLLLLLHCIPSTQSSNPWPSSAPPVDLAEAQPPLHSPLHPSTTTATFRPPSTALSHLGHHALRKSYRGRARAVEGKGWLKRMSQSAPSDVCQAK